MDYSKQKTTGQAWDKSITWKEFSKRTGAIYKLWCDQELSLLFNGNVISHISCGNQIHFCSRVEPVDLKDSDELEIRWDGRLTTVVNTFNELRQRQNAEAAFAKAAGYDFGYGRYWETMTLEELREAQTTK